MTRLNSRLESEGAEFLVLGALLIEGIPTYKSYARMPGYDLVATNPDAGSSVRIQVKSRWATDYDGGFLIKNFECDFVVFVALNRGFRYARNNSEVRAGAGKRAPDFYVFPVEVVKAALYEKSKWGKARTSLIPNVGSYRDNWGLIQNRLGHNAVVVADGADVGSCDLTPCTLRDNG